MKLYALIIILALAACSTPTGEVVNEPITIGAVLPLTGMAAFHGNNEKEGIELAVKEINAAGGIDGRPVRVIFEDDQSVPAKSLTAVNKLVDVNGVQVIIGGSWDILANAVIPEIDRRKVVLVSPSALPDTITEESDYFITVQPPVAIKQEIIEEFLREIEGDRIGVIAMNNPWALAHLTTFEKAIANTDKTLVKKVVLPHFDNNDLATDIALLNDLDLDAWLINVNFADNAMFAKKRTELDIREPILAHEGFAQNLDAERISQDEAEGVVVYKFTPPSEAFQERFFAEYGKMPEQYHDLSYDAVYLLKHAMEIGGSEPEGILSAMDAVSFEGASGHIEFNDEGYITSKKPLLKIIRDGKRETFEGLQ